MHRRNILKESRICENASKVSFLRILSTPLVQKCHAGHYFFGCLSRGISRGTRFLRRHRRRLCGVLESSQEVSNLKCKLRRIFGVSRRAARAGEMAAKLKRNLIPSFSGRPSPFLRPCSTSLPPTVSLSLSPCSRRLFIHCVSTSLRSLEENVYLLRFSPLSTPRPRLFLVSGFWNADYRFRAARENHLVCYSKDRTAPRESRCRVTPRNGAGRMQKPSSFIPPA